MGPGRDHYRRFVIERLGSRLKSLDGLKIGDDERGNAAEWVEKQKKIYGKAAAILDAEWDILDKKGIELGRHFAKARARQSLKKSRELLPDDIEIDDNAKKKADRGDGPEMKDRTKDNNNTEEQGNF